MFGGFAPLPLRLGGTDTEGWTAAQFMRAASDLRAAVKTAPFAVFRLRGSTLEIKSYASMVGMGDDYAPTATNEGSGVFRITWAATYQDKLLIIEMDSDALTTDQPWVTLEIDSTASELLVSAVAICKPRFEAHDPLTLIS